MMSRGLSGNTRHDASGLSGNTRRTTCLIFQYGFCLPFQFKSNLLNLIRTSLHVEASDTIFLNRLLVDVGANPLHPTSTGSFSSHFWVPGSFFLCFFKTIFPWHCKFHNVQYASLLVVDHRTMSCWRVEAIMSGGETRLFSNPEWYAGCIYALIWFDALEVGLLVQTMWYRNFLYIIIKEQSWWFALFQNY